MRFLNGEEGVKLSMIYYFLQIAPHNNNNHIIIIIIIIIMVIIIMIIMTIIIIIKCNFNLIWRSKSWKDALVRLCKWASFKSMRLLVRTGWGGGGEVQLVRPVAAGGGSLIGSSNNNDNNNQHLKTIHNQTNTKELLCRTITIRVNRAMPLTDADCPVVGTYFSLSSCNFTAALIIASGLQ